MTKSAAWFGFGTQAAYHKAKPYVVLLKSIEPCKYGNRHTTLSIRVPTAEEAEEFAAMPNAISGILYRPNSRGFEGYAEDEYPHYIL